MNASLMVENVTGIKNGITISVSMSVKIQKNIVRSKKIIFGMLQHMAAELVDKQEILLMIQ